MSSLGSFSDPVIQNRCWALAANRRDFFSLLTRTFTKPWCDLYISEMSVATDA